MKYSKRILIFLLLWTAAFISNAVIGFANSPDANKVRVAVISYPNYLQINDGGNVTGFAYDYLQGIKEYTDWEYEYVLMPLEEAIKAVEKGEIDILPGCQYTADRASRSQFSAESMGKDATVLCTRTDNNRYMFNDFANYNGMKIAALAGSLRIEQTKRFLADYGVQAEFVEFASDSASKEALDKGEVDAILMSAIRCESKYKIIARTKLMPLYFMTNKFRPEIAQGINMAMEKIHRNYPYYEAKLDNKYYSNVLVQTALSAEEQRYIENIGVITVAISKELYPTEYYDEDSGEFKGIVVDSFKLISQTTGLKFRFVPRDNLAALKQKMQAGEIQLIASVADDLNVADTLDVLLSNPYNSNALSIIVNDKISDYDDTGISVAVYKDMPMFAKKAHDMGYTKLTYCDTLDECVEMVNSGAVDLSFVTTYSLGKLVNHSFYNHINIYSIPDSTYGYCIGIYKNKNPILKNILNKAINGMTDDVKNEMVINNIANNNQHQTIRDFIYAHLTMMYLIVIVILLICVIAAVSVARTKQKANRKLEAAIRAANLANHAKSDFLSKMSHDLRTPLNSVIGYSNNEMLKDTTVAEQADYFQKINSSAKYLLNLINDMLDVSKIESGKLKINYQRYDVEDFLSGLTNIIQPLAKQKNIKLNFDFSKVQYRYVMADKLTLEKIFLNLLNNAIKFTPSGGKVSFTIEQQPLGSDRVIDRFTVMDNGIGMSKKFIPHIFEPFMQENAISNEGTGLGLTIVKNLVDELGGTIQVNSELGKGTTFIIELSFTVCTEAEPAARQKLVDNADNFKGKRILLCEDHPLNREIATKLLNRKGIQVDIAENGRVGVDKYLAMEGNYDAVLMDIRMPVLNGLEAAKEIRTAEVEKGYRHIPIIAMTANAFDDDRKLSREAGMEEHLAKPINPRELYGALAKYMSGE